MKTKTTLPTIVISILLLVVAARAAYIIFGPVRTENLTDYTLSMNTSSVGLEVHFDGVLLHGTQPQAGQPISIFHSNLDGSINSGNTTAILMLTTDINGAYSGIYLEPANGTYHYVPEYVAG